MKAIITIDRDRNQARRGGTGTGPERSTMPGLATMPTELILSIARHLTPVSRYCLSLTCRRLRQTIDLDFRNLPQCEKWAVTTRLEQDLKVNEMPERLACVYCKCKRPARDFGYRKPLIGARIFRSLRRIPLVCKILNRFPSLHCLNWYSMCKYSEGSAFNYEPWGRCCYRHDHLWYSSRKEKLGKTIPAIGELRYENPLFVNTARYAAIEVQCCGHCGRLVEDDDTREHGCKHCDCGICRSPKRRTQFFRAGEGDRPGIVVEYLAVHPERKNSEWKVLPLERGSECVASNFQRLT